MTATESCGQCRFWLDGDELGVCHRHAPMPYAAENEPGDAETVWPLTSANQWCGEFEKKA